MEIEGRFLAFAFAKGDLLMEVNQKHQITLAVGAASSLTPFSDTQLQGRNLFEIIDPEDAPMLRQILVGLKSVGRKGPVAIRLKVKRPDGSPLTAQISVCTLPSLKGSIAISMSHPASTMSAQKAAREMPIRDPETSVLSAKSFQEQASDLLRAARESDRPLEMLLLDFAGIDNLRQDLTENKKAEFGDRLGGILRSLSVDGETVGRISKDRFGIVHTPGDAVDETLNEIKKLSRQFAPKAAPIEIKQTTLGLVSDSLSVDDSVRALRYAINRFANLPPGERPPNSLSESLQTLVEETVERARDITSLINDDHFTLQFQPIVSLSTGIIHHYEALIRFKNPQATGEMVQFAEELGIIERLDIAVCNRVIKQLIETPQHSIAVNISGKSIENFAFSQALHEILKENKSTAARLHLEITESAQLSNLEEVNKIIQTYREMGYHVCLDDFGAGSASFQYLQALVVDVVKIDGTYIKRLGTSRRDDTLLKGLIRICSDLGIETIAEYVELPQQVEQLRGMGVHMGQGYLFGKPTSLLGEHSDNLTMRRKSNPLITGNTGT